jgi:cytoskeletal protein RodZ
MTARHQLRIGNRRIGRDRAPIDATAAPPIGETLQLARERKGVDLFRAERDTKIRLRYLSALEDGDYAELPSPVYTKGFLRNYAIYLGLEPDEIIDRWRDEMEAMRTATRVAVAPPPMPLLEPGGRRVTITPSMIVASLVAIVVLAFVGYIAIQFLRFVETTPVALTYPANVFTQLDAEQITLEGTAGPGALISITGPGGDRYNATANEAGEWSYEVPLAGGRNDFSIVATDPVTQRESRPIALTINVPLPEAPSPGASPTSAPAVVLALNLNSPADGVVSQDGIVTVSGTTNGSRVTITSTFLGPPDGTPEPSPKDSPAPSASPQATGSPGPIGPARELTPNALGAFSETLRFDPGRWQIMVASYSSGQTPVARQVEVIVQPISASGIELVISVQGRRSWVRIVADGERIEGYGNRTLRPGETHTVTALDEMCLRTGNAGALRLTLNGEDLGVLGRNGQTGSWIIRPGQDLERAPASCT